MKTIPLNDGWKLYEAPLAWKKDKLAQVLRTKESLPCSLPADVRMPLVAAGKAEDPVEADNSRRGLWIEDRSWWFVKDFDWKGGEYGAVELALDRLDYGADIFLNGVHVGRHDNVFYPFIKDVREWLEGNNTLAVRLTCGLEGVSEEDVAGIDGAVCTEILNGCDSRGDRRRPYLRKPQYTAGWDWGPRAVTCGIGSASLNAYESLAIRSAMFSTESIEGGTARVRVSVMVEDLLPASSLDADISVALKSGGKVAASAERKDALLVSGRNYVDFVFDVPGAKLWWPNGYGAQPLYDLEAKASSGGSSIVYGPVSVGIRTLTLDTSRLDAENRRFAFTINGVPIFCKGASWIPADSIYARVPDEKYEKLIAEAREANFTMLRVWGGGLYEKDIFYNLCDKHGLLVWQDFMFACAAYPDHIEEFREEVRRELDHQTLRLGSRACLAVFCGNNENHWIFHAGVRSRGLSGLIVYGQLEPEAVRRNCPHVPWWPSSPYGGAFPNDNNVGGRHLWNDYMMHPDMEKRITPEGYDKVTSKFVAEYGYPGPCRKASIERYFAGKPVERGGEVWNLHNNTYEKHTVAAGIRKHYTEPDNLSLDEYLLYASATQAMMLGYSLEAIRCVPECWGALFWMYGDCWGETGWTIIDYYLRRKPSYYAVKRAFAPKKLILRERDGLVHAHAFNETAEELRLDVEYGYVSFDGSLRDTKAISIAIPPRSKGVPFTFKAEGRDDKRGVWFARADGLDTAILRRAPFRELMIPPAKLEILNARDEGFDRVFEVRADTFAHFVHFGFGDDSRLSDELFDLLPGETKLVRAYGEAGGKITVKHI